MTVYHLRNVQNGPRSGTPSITSFSKRELSILLPTYGRMVAAGRWRDYGISHLTHTAVFSVFSRAFDGPLYNIEKQPRLKSRNALYRIIGMDGRIFRQCNDLTQLMRFFDKELLRIVA